MQAKPPVSPADLKDQLSQLAQQANVDKTVFAQLISNLSQALISPLINVLDKAQTLRQADIAEEYKNTAAQIQETTSDLLTLVNKVVSFAQSLNNPEIVANSAVSIINDEFILPDECKLLHILVVDDDTLRGKSIIKTLENMGLQDIGLAHTNDALAALRKGLQGPNPFQVVIISTQTFDHHVNYLARTIKASVMLNSVMLALAVPSKLMDFEKERAYFGGFACLLNLESEPTRLLNKLINSWRSWAAKSNLNTDAAAPIDNHCVLLVEDDPIPQKAALRQLGELGYQVDIAPDGHTALKLLEQNQYSLVFMDIGLPDISGLDVTAEFRKRENGKRRTPIIGLTIYALESDEENGLQAGMDEYLVKPLMQDRLRAVLDRWAVSQK